MTAVPGCKSCKYAQLYAYQYPCNGCEDNNNRYVAANQETVVHEAEFVELGTVQSKHSHYYKDVTRLTHIDVYRVLSLFEVTDPCIQHAVKKLLVTGGRGAKDFEQDLNEAIDTLLRRKQMIDEDKV